MNLCEVYFWAFLRLCFWATHSKDSNEILSKVVQSHSLSWNTHVKRLVEKFSLQIKQPMVDIKGYLLKSLIHWSKSRVPITTSTKLNWIPYQFSCQTSSCNWTENQKTTKTTQQTWHTSACLQECALARCQGVQPCRSLRGSMSNRHFFWMSIFRYAKKTCRQLRGSGFLGGQCQSAGALEDFEEG